MDSLYDRIAGQSPDRIAALSDGLFAVAMTLLVLDMRVPPDHIVASERGLRHALLDMRPQIVTYLMSFLTLGILWLGQQTQLHFFVRSDRNLTWIHIAFLFAVSMIPFSTDLLAAFITYRVALVVYWVNLLVLGTLLYLSFAYAERAGLVRKNVTKKVGLAIRQRIIVAQVLYAFGALLCIASTYASIAVIVLVQLNYAIAPFTNIFRRRPHDTPTAS